MTLVYASNRNTGPNDDPRGDPIAVFTLDPADRKLQIIDRLFTRTRLKQVRGMQFGEPDDGFLVASGLVVDGGVVVLERVVQGAEFVQVPSNKNIPNFTLNVTSLPFDLCSHRGPDRFIPSEISPTR